MNYSVFHLQGIGLFRVILQYISITITPAYVDKLMVGEEEQTCPGNNVGECTSCEL